MTTSNNTAARTFAEEVVARLVAAGFTAVWAGGCVRDELLGKIPKDYDVATSATPDQVIALFGKRKTVPVGVSFGVVMVLGSSKDCGQIEVATFRSDGEYLDGRRPDSIEFCSPQQDALRRDFTINGMFYDPLADELLDYVGGQADLKRRVVRAIGEPAARFEEDKLRMLRAVRFSATFGFALEDATAAAIRGLKSELRQVSVERIAAEFRRVMAHESRATALDLLLQTDLFGVLFDQYSPENAQQLRALLAALQEPKFEPAFAGLFGCHFEGQHDHTRNRCRKVRDACKSWKLANSETDSICWILDSAWQCQQANPIPLHVIKPILANEQHALVIDYLKAVAVADQQRPVSANQLKDYLSNVDQKVLNPAPFITGQDLFDLGAKAGPHFSALITDVRRLQLDEVLRNKEEAIEWTKDKLQDIDT